MNTGAGMYSFPFQIPIFYPSLAPVTPIYRVVYSNNNLLHNSYGLPIANEQHNLFLCFHCFDAEFVSETAKDSNLYWKSTGTTDNKKEGD